MMNADNTDEILTNHTNPRPQRSINNWMPYYITLAVWIVVIISALYWLSIHFS